MQLSLQTDYSLRVLVYLALKQDNRASIEEIASAYDISENHLMKVVHNLSKQDLIKTTRGRFGGIHLEKKPEDINIGFVVKKLEKLEFVECLGKNNTCKISRFCGLKHMLNQAKVSFIKTLEQHTLADAIGKTRDLKNSLHIPILNKV